LRLSKLQSQNTSKEQKEAYRRFYLKTNINQAKWGILLFITPMVSFIVNDYLLFGVSIQLAGLASLRAFMLIISLLEFFYIRKVTDPAAYDLTLFGFFLALAMCGGVINFFRPENFVVQAILTSISVFVIYIVVPFRFKYQCIVGTIVTVGESAIVLLIANPTSTAMVFTIIFSLQYSNLIAAVSAWQLQAYRRKAFSEYQKRIKIQEDLEKNNLHLEELIEEKTKELKKTERLAAIGSTASMVGHDLRNPLTAISSATYYLKKNYNEQMKPKGKEMLELIQNNVQFSDKIINDLLDYSREIHLENKKTSPSKIIQEALTIVNIPLNVQVIYDTDETQEVNVDFDKMKRVFVNLIKNAVDAMPNGGILTIKTEFNEDGTRISFADNGAGIAEENQKNLFQPLFTTKAKGMGFGLAICQRIIEAHNGKISIQSTPNKGTTVTIQLPQMLLAYK
jgi:signal transduction histidine kinase